MGPLDFVVCEFHVWRIADAHIWHVTLCAAAIGLHAFNICAAFVLVALIAYGADRFDFMLVWLVTIDTLQCLLRHF